jgi:hypothetical protein
VATAYSPRGIRVMSQSHYNDLSRLAPMATDDVMRLWDQYDGINEPDGISGEAIHEMLNARGQGSYCAV